MSTFPSPSSFRPTRAWQPKEIVQTPELPDNDGKKLQFDTDLKVATVATQVFDAMIKNGVANACLFTGVQQVFFHVKEDDPQTLHYFLVDLNSDIESMKATHEDLWKLEPVTAVGRLLTPCLMSLETPIRDQNWRNQAMDQLPKWTPDAEKILAQVTDEESSAGVSASA